MSFKFNGSIKNYAEIITSEALKTAFEEYGFKVKLIEEQRLNEDNTPYFKGYKPQAYFKTK